MRKVFKELYEVSNTITTKREAPALGGPIARRLAEALGDITFIVELPVSLGLKPVALDEINPPVLY